MADPVVKLLPSRGLTRDDLDNPNGRRYTPQDRERAYLYWRHESGRSLRRTEEGLGVSLSTLSDWSRKDGWMDRARAEDAEDSDAARSAIAGRTMPMLDRGLARLARIIDDEATPAMATVKAIELLAKLTGTLAPANAGQPLQPAAAGGRTVSMEELLAMDPDELTAWPGDDWDAGRTG